MDPWQPLPDPKRSPHSSIFLDRVQGAVRTPKLIAAWHRESVIPAISKEAWIMRFR